MVMLTALLPTEPFDERFTKTNKFYTSGTRHTFGDVARQVVGNRAAFCCTNWRAIRLPNRSERPHRSYSLLHLPDTTHRCFHRARANIRRNPQRSRAMGPTLDSYLGITLGTLALLKPKKRIAESLCTDIRPRHNGLSNRLCVEEVSPTPIAFAFRPAVGMQCCR